MLIEELETIYTIMMAIAESSSIKTIANGIFIYLCLAGIARCINPIRRVIVKHVEKKE